MVALHCVETVNNGDDVWLLQRYASPDERPKVLGSMAIEDYRKRYDKARSPETVDPAAEMFPDPEAASTLSPSEISAYVAYLLARSEMLSIKNIPPGGSVTAYENMRTLPPQAEVA